MLLLWGGCEQETELCIHYDTIYVCFFNEMHPESVKTTERKYININSGYW